MLIPKEERKQIVDLLHCNHAGDKSMMSQAKGCFFWPGLHDDLKEKFKQCEARLEFAPSKPDPHYDVSPNSLFSLALKEEISCDYFDESRSLSSKIATQDTCG